MVGICVWASFPYVQHDLQIVYYMQGFFLGRGHWPPP